MEQLILRLGDNDILSITKTDTKVTFTGICSNISVTNVIVFLDELPFIIGTLFGYVSQTHRDRETSCETYGKCHLTIEYDLETFDDEPVYIILSDIEENHFCKLTLEQTRTLLKFLL